MRFGRLAPLVALAVSGCVSAPDQESVGLGGLAPISPKYRAEIVGWSRTFFVDPRALRAAQLSDPVLIRDNSGRLFYLVCLDVVNTAPSARSAASERFAFGFAPPNYFSAPLQRMGATLTNAACDERPLAYRPFPELTRL